MAPVADETSDVRGPPVLDDADRDHFDAFGYLRLRGLLLDVIDRLRSEAAALVDHERPRVLTCAQFMDATSNRCETHARLVVTEPLGDRRPMRWLRDDPRIRAIADALLSPGYEYVGSLVSLFNCDVLWHHDSALKGSDGRQIGVMLYLDPLSGSDGALRVIPGSHRRGALRRILERELMSSTAPVREAFGVPAADLPARVLDVVPGDVIVLDFDVVHASFHGGTGRRLLSASFGPPHPDGGWDRVLRAAAGAARPATADEVARSRRADEEAGSEAIRS